MGTNQFSVDSVCDERLLALIRGCMREDRECQRLLYRQFYGYAMGVCLRYSRSSEEAMEVLNDGFMKIFTKLNKYDSEKSFKGWVRRIMINTALDNYRKELKHYYKNDIEGASHIVAVEDNAIGQLAYNELIAMIQTLSPAYRTVFCLYVIDGYSHEEIAEMLNISIGTSKSNLSKARVNLQGMLKKSHKDEHSNYARG